MATDVARLAMQIDVTGARRAQSALDAVRSGSVKLTRATEAQIAQSRRLSSTFRAQAEATRFVGRQTRLVGGNFRNIAQQLNQVAQQGAATGNFFQALAIQLPDLVAGMGPLGILLGGLAGGFAALALSSQESEESISELADKTKELVTELGRATDLQRQFINAQFQQSIQEQKTVIAEAEESIRSVNARLEDFRRAVGDNVPDAVFNSNSAVQSLRDELQKSQLAIDNANSSIDAITRQQKEFWQEVEETSSRINGATDELERFVDSIVAQGVAVGKSARETALYRAERLGANDADIQAINNAFDLIEAENARQEQIKQTIKEQRALDELRAQADPAMAEFNRYADQIDQIERFNITAEEKERLREAAFAQHQQRMAQIAKAGADATVSVSSDGMSNLVNQQQMLNQQLVGTFGNVLGAIRGFTQQGTAEWIAMTIAQKAIMAGQAIMAANLAAAQTLSASIIPGDPTSPFRAVALAETVRNIGYVNAGLIAAQGVAEISQSFEGGGFTGTGSRSGGIDGRGGFPAILHPNETVIDHTKGQTLGGDTIINIHEAPAGTRMERRTGTNGGEVIDIFIADIATGGPMSKSMQSTFGLKRQGR